MRKIKFFVQLFLRTFLKESKQRTFVQNWCFAGVCWSGTVAVAEQQRTTND